MLDRFLAALLVMIEATNECNVRGKEKEIGRERAREREKLREK